MVIEVLVVLSILVVTSQQNLISHCNYEDEITRRTCTNFELGKEKFQSDWDKLSLKNITGSINSSTFSNLTKLIYLSISDSHIENVATGSFATLPNLIFLVLCGNKKFPQLDKSIFEGVTEHLSWLSIIRNNMAISEDSFDNIKNLTWLHLQDQNITRLSHAYLSETVRLHELTITHCGLESIDENAFENTTDLEILNLNFNKIKNFRLETFRNLKKLRILELHHNKFMQFNLEPFRYLNSLEIVGFPSHFLKEIENVGRFVAVFPNLKKVEVKRKDLISDETKSVVSELRKRKIHIIGTPHDHHLPPIFRHGSPAM